MNTKKNEEENLEEFEVNYNDRMDGYGAGPPEYMDDKLPYEKERKRLPDVGVDEYGLRNQYGPVDQYNFRDMYERRWSRPRRYPEDFDDWREWDRELESDYVEGNYPGVSGKTRRGNTWFNRSKYDEQRSFMGKGPKGYRRSDDRIYDEVCETLMRSPDIDASHIGVKVHEGEVELEGWVHSRQNKRLAEYLIEDLPGVEEVLNKLSIISNSEEIDHGPGAVKRKDLGV